MLQAALYCVAVGHLAVLAGRHSERDDWTEGKVYTLSPWPIDQYWEMTRTLDPDDYDLG